MRGLAREPFGFLIPQAQELWKSWETSADDTDTWLSVGPYTNGSVGVCTPVSAQAAESFQMLGLQVAFSRFIWARNTMRMILQTQTLPKWLVIADCNL